MSDQSNDVIDLSFIFSPANRKQIKESIDFYCYWCSEKDYKDFQVLLQLQIELHVFL